MKTLATLTTIALISITAHAGSWGFTLGNGASFSYGNQNNCERSYQQPRHQVYYPSEHTYLTPPVYIKRDLYQPPVIMQRAVRNSSHGYSSQEIISRPACGGYPNRW